jgi:hypothetical protein
MPKNTEPARQISAEQAAVEQNLVDTVVASFSNTEDPRLKELMHLTRNLHNFVREVRLTEDEWNTGIGFLTTAGNITDGKRQEFVPLSDVPGASMPTIAINNEAYKGATEATVFGPFFVDDAPEIPTAGTSPAAPRGNRAGSKAPSRTRTADRSPGPASRSGRPTKTVSPTSSTRTSGWQDAPICSPMTSAATRSGPLPPPRTPADRNRRQRLRRQGVPDQEVYPTARRHPWARPQEPRRARLGPHPVRHSPCPRSIVMSGARRPV